MPAPSTNTDVEMLSLTSTGPDAKRRPRPGLYRLLQGCSSLGTKSARARTRTCRHRLKRNPRGVLIWGLLWYAVLQLIPLLRLWGTTEHPWHAIGEAIEARKGPRLRQIVAETPDRPLLLLLGSSRTCWAVRAGAFDGMPDSDGRPLRAYNFAIPTNGAVSELLHLREILAEGIRPRFLLIEFNPQLLSGYQRFTLNEEDMMCVESTSARNVLRWLPYFQHPQKRVGEWLSARLAPWYAFRQQIRVELLFLAKNRPCPTYEGLDDWGWHLPLAKLWPPSERVARLAMAYRTYAPQLQSYRLGKKPVQALHELLDLCRRKKIPAAFLIMPESSHFRSWYSADAKKAIHGLLDELKQTYGVPVIDANTWIDDDDFEDGQHALVHGTDVFTARLAAELPRLLAQSKAAKSD